MTESELWPEHLHRARNNRIPTFLINARISDRSFKRYQEVPRFAKRLLQKLDYVFAASDLDQARLIELGANADTTVSTGSIKFDVTLGTQLDQLAHGALCEELGFGHQAEQEPPFILLGSSTWPGEEAALLRIQASVIATGIDCRLLLVPRHAERALEIIRLLKQQPLTWHQRSQNTATQTASVFSWPTQLVSSLASRK